MIGISYRSPINVMNLKVKIDDRIVRHTYYIHNHNRDYSNEIFI